MQLFLKKIAEQNPLLLAYAFSLHRKGEILPDSYVLDLDSIMENAQQILSCAKEHRISLYFMLKQLGRNPLIGKRLQELGFEAAVCVDYREALLYIRHGIRLGHVGHLTQIPTAALPAIVEAKPEVITVYSIEKARQIASLARQANRCQPILLRVTEPQDYIYPGQKAGFTLSELPNVVHEIKQIDGVVVEELTAFPCFTFSDMQYQLTPNARTLQTAADMLRQLGVEIHQINMPSASCCDTLPRIAQAGGTHAEPGHGLTGTTPLHAYSICPEKPALVYVSEVMHHFDNHSYCLGGGNYARGHMQSAMVGERFDQCDTVSMTPPPAGNIDYHFELQGIFPIGSTVLSAFRTQIFHTRSQVVVVEGLSNGNPRILGVYSAQGERIG